MSPSKHPSLRTYSSDSAQAPAKPKSICLPRPGLYPRSAPDLPELVEELRGFLNDSNVQPGLGSTFPHSLENGPQEC